MQINKAYPAFFAMQKAMEQPKLLLDMLQKSVYPEQTLAAPPNSATQESDIATQTGKGQQINIIA